MNPPFWPTKQIADSGPAFRYSELESATSQIRLVKVLRTGDPSNPETPLKLELSHANLHDKPLYVALSYTWGSPDAGFPAEWDDPSYTFPVCINDCVLYIRPNLYSALLEFRRILSEDKFIWIDAICINQSNIAERNAQVQNMASIYSQSAIAMAWLGPEDGLSRTAFQIMTDMAESWNRLPKFLRQPSVPDEHLEQYRDFAESHLGREESFNLWQSVVVFLQRRLFTRAWIVQEVCCAPEVIVFSNAQWMTWSKLADVYSSVVHYSVNLKRAMPKDWELWSDFMTTLSTDLTSLKDLLNSVLLYKARGIIGKLPELPDMLNRLRRTNASDSRDKVYAARSLSNLALKVDYNKTTEEVFIETALTILATPYGLNLLDDCYLPVDDGLPLPSWVPDWTKSRSEHYFPLPKRGRIVHGVRAEGPLYSAGGQDGNSRPQYVPAKRLLMIPAFLSDSFDFVGTQLCDAEVASPPQQGGKLSEWINWKTNQVVKSQERWVDIFASLVSLHEWAANRTSREQLIVDGSNGEALLDLDSWVYDPKAGRDQFSIPTYKPTGESLQKAYERTMYCDLVLDHVSNRERRSSEHVSSHDPEPMLRIPYRAFACSKLGLFALVPQETAIGDRIAIVRGHEVPLVVREKDEGFQLIGECYVHGIMDGELAKDHLFDWIPLI